MFICPYSYVAYFPHHCPHAISSLRSFPFPSQLKLNHPIFSSFFKYHLHHHHHHHHHHQYPPVSNWHIGQGPGVSIFLCWLQPLIRGRTYAKKMRFLRKIRAGYANLKMPCVYCTQKTVSSHIKMHLVFSFFAPSREGL